MRIAVLDIGGTSIKSGMFRDGELINREEHATHAAEGGEAVMRKAEEILAGCQQPFERIGVSTAGQVDTGTGVIRFANENIPRYTGMRVKERLQERFGVPVAVENDVNAAAVGEAVYGAGRGLSDFLCLTYGTGVGGAIIIGGKVYAGSAFSAGEFGHMVTHSGGEACNCGGRGCYERYASVSALVRRASALDPALADGRVIFSRLGEPGVKAVVDAWIGEISVGLATLVHIFNPARIVLGGGIMNEKYVMDELNARLYQCIMPSYANVELRQAHLRNAAGMLGAAYLAQAIPNT